MELSAADWLKIVRGEYLEDFIHQGGAAVKFVVPASRQDGQAILGELRAAAEAGDYCFASVDATSTKLHLIDRLFHEVARQVDWDALAYAFLARLLAEQGLKLPAQPEDPLHLAEIARLNDLAEPPLRLEVTRWLWNRLFRDYRMSQEFRLAMIRLCRAHLDPDDEPTVTSAVREWLRGELRLLSAVKRALIFQKIARHNARHMLVSLAHWLKIAGRSGLVLGLDITRYAETSRPSERDGSFYYSIAAALDAYEVLRQLIDGTDELEYCFVAVVAGPAFLSDDRRGLRSYHALNLRVADDVRDRFRQNPFASLVRTAPASQASAG
jgi:bacteriophage exclusion system BrxC/D-like protein